MEIEDRNKLLMRVKNKTDQEKLTINSQMYFIADSAIFTTGDLIRQKSSLMLAWLEGEMLRTKALYEPPQGFITINKVIAKHEKQVMLVMLSDNTVAIVSSENPVGLAPQIVKQPKS